jgi:hypothetical protein
MKKSILQKLYDGKIYPSENIVISNPEYDKLNSELSGKKERFLKNLSDGERENFTEIEDLINELNTIYSYENFAHGFKLAVNLIFESLNGADNITQNDEND